MLQPMVCCFTSLTLLFLVDVMISQTYKVSTMLVIGSLGAVFMEATSESPSQSDSHACPLGLACSHPGFGAHIEQGHHETLHDSRWVGRT